MFLLYYRLVPTLTHKRPTNTTCCHIVHLTLVITRTRRMVVSTPLRHTLSENAWEGIRCDTVVTI